MCAVLLRFRWSPLVSHALRRALFIAAVAALGACAVQQPADSPESASSPASPRPAVSAVSQLLEDSRSQFAAGQWQAAIATAERALRIDRREPELYFLLAKSYQALADLERARQFARQGLRHAGSPDSPMALALDNFLFALDHPEP